MAVVPTFRPESGPLMDLLEVLAAQADVIVADDASPCTSDRVLADVASQGIPVVRHSHNAGIARSLNDGLRHAQATGADWLLTVDQDTVITWRDCWPWPERHRDQCASEP